MPSSGSVIARSGIQTNQSGERHIPQSVRADGSVRKEIKIRPGYRPPEDVEVYKNRAAEGWKTRGNAGIPGAEGLSSAQDVAATSRGKNAKRREARKKAKQNEDIEDTCENSGTKPISEAPENLPDQATIQTIATTAQASQPEDKSNGTIGEQPEAEAGEEKQARNLKKRLRQARDLQSKKESGESLLPEQFAKVIKISELIRQLNALGFDSDGARKPKDTR